MTWGALIQALHFVQVLLNTEIAGMARGMMEDNVTNKQSQKMTL